MVKIAIIGTGYVGLVTGACLADFGNSVICIDTDEKKIEMLKKGIIPIYEPGLDVIVNKNNQSDRLRFTGEFASSIKQSEIVFIAVGTPSAEDGSADLQYIEQAAREIGQCIEKYIVVVNKSTVPVGTGQKVKAWIQEELNKRELDIPFDIVSNPEFLREGTAVYDFTHPDRVVIGAENDRSRKLMRDVYHAMVIREISYIETNVETAEMIKYASNAFLAVKISFINEIANLCEKINADVHDVAKAMGRDGRIGSKFLHPGPGYGGSCFPKDTRAIAAVGRQHQFTLSIIEAAIKANEFQKLKMVDKIESGIGRPLTGKTIAILGLAFKLNTNDMRESPAITICESLVKRGAALRVWDPAAMEEASRYFASLKNSIYFAKDGYDTLIGSHGVVLITDWYEFRNLDLIRIKNDLVSPNFFDLRNMYKREEVEAAGLNYFGVGR